MFFIGSNIMETLIAIIASAELIARTIIQLVTTWFLIKAVVLPDEAKSNRIIACAGLLIFVKLTTNG